LPRQNDDRVRGDDRFANGHVVLVTSAEPAEGKTTVVANLAAAFAEKDAGVVVVSGDARHPSVEALLLGRRAAGAKLATDKQSESVLTMIPGVNLVLSCDPITNPADIVSYERAVVRRARARSQTVVIDTPPALVANDATELMHVADSVVLVARCGSTSMASARRTADLISRWDVAVVGVVLIGTPAAAVADANYYRTRPAPRPTLASWHRREVAHTEIAEVPAPPRAEVTATATVPPIDDGGIWRLKSVIDLSSAHSALEDEPEATDERFDHPERLPLFRGPDRPSNGAPK
jgi:cellulose biosynthesis protein BcsQ